jgi:anti-sigma factor RsiW
MTEPRLTCRECVEFLMDYLDDGLPPDVRVIFERHLAACANCVRYLESYKTTTTICKKAFEVRDSEPLPQVPEELVKAILAARPKAE